MYVSRVTVVATRPRPQFAVSLAAAVAAVCVVTLFLADHSALADPLTPVLTVIWILSATTAAMQTSNAQFSPTFICAVLAIGLLGPAATFVIIVVAELVVWAIERYRWRALVINLAGIPGPYLMAAVAFDLAGPTEGTLGFFILLAVAGLAGIAMNIALVGTLIDILDGRRTNAVLRELKELAPTLAISIAFTLTIVEGYLEFGMVAVVGLMIGALGAGYILQLLAKSREQSREYVNLSWGVLSSLVRTLNERDDRASRHSAAVARFSRDMAEVAGLEEKEIQLAHTSGLLHDIGKFALSDRVMERGVRLTEADWKGIRRHPDIGADLLRDIGVYGPVSEVVRCHHERVDGRGYPRGLTGAEIPEVAKIVAVAEVYDTLTAPDTYRTPMNSFEALRELRRVSGVQLDEVYVEALATLLAGRSLEYRHADAADFDIELAMERRIKESVKLI